MEITPTQAETSHPQREIILNEQPIIIAVVPHTFHTNTVGETRHADIITLKNTQGKEVMYRIAGSPITHRFAYTTRQNEPEYQTLQLLQTKQTDHMVSLVGDTTEETNAYKETAIPGFSLVDVISATINDQRLSQEQKKYISCQLFTRALQALQEFNSHNLMHNHPFTANFLITDEGKAFIIDYTRSKPVTNQNEDYYNSDTRFDLRLFVTALQSSFGEKEGMEFLDELTAIVGDWNNDYDTQVTKMVSIFQNAANQSLPTTTPLDIAPIMLRKTLHALDIDDSTDEALTTLQTTIQTLTKQAAE